MIGLGTIVNTAAIVAGGIAGTFIKSGLPERFKKIVMQAIGLSVLLIGVSGTLQGMYRVLDGGKLDRQYTMLMIFSLVIGAVVGEWMNIEDKLEKLGQWFQARFAKGGGDFAEGFVTASLIYCVGAMAIIGALEDGLRGSTDTLFTKSILDGVSSVIFAATMGIGVAFSAVPVLIYQGAITLMASFIEPLLTPEVITQVSMVGSVLILGIGLTMLDIKKIKVGNMLPAILVPFVYYMIKSFLPI